MVKQQRAETDQWKMPPVEIGQTVIWRPEPGAQEFLALVTVAGANNITVALLYPHTRNFDIRDGVRHVDDPGRKDMETKDLGVWEYTPWHKRLLELIDQVEGALTFPRGE